MVSLLLLACSCARGPLVDTLQITATPVSGALPVEDPESPVWDRAAEHPAKLMVQDVAEPRLTVPGVELVRVRALHDRGWIAFRLEWADKTKDLIPQPGRSSDAAAIQLPVQPGADVPNAAMGEKGKPVEILYWKAVWQDDEERAARGGGDRIAALYPNLAIDHYPFAPPSGSSPPGGPNPAVRTEMETRYQPAAAARNPITIRPQAGPVQTLRAEGFGGSTVAASQQAKGRGVWKAGQWIATIARPLRVGEGSAALQVGQKTYVAIAVWDGAAGHAGSRKMRSGWIPLVLEGS